MDSRSGSAPIRDSMALAKEGAESIGKFPHLFTSAIRALSTQRGFGVADKIAAGEKLPSATDFLIKRSPTLRAMLFFCAEESRPEDLAKLSPLTTQSLLTLFTPGEVAAVIGLTLLYRRMRRRCDKEEWKFWMENLPTHMKVCAAVGDTFQRVGFGGGMLVGGMRFLGSSVFLSHDMKAFQEFRRKLKTQKDKLFDLEAEKVRWGCQHLEICSSLLQTLGYGLGVGMGFGMEKVNRRPEMSEDEFRILEEETISWQATIKWAESLHARGKAPDGISKDDIFYLPDEVTAELVAQVKAIVDAGTEEGWITRALSSLPKDAAEKLGVDLAKLEEDLEGEVGE